MPKSLLATTLACTASVALFGLPSETLSDAPTIELHDSASSHDDGAWEDEMWRANLAMEGLPVGGFLAGAAVVPEDPEPGSPIKLLTWARNVAGGWALPVYCWQGPCRLQIRDQSGNQIPMSKEGKGAFGSLAGGVGQSARRSCRLVIAWERRSR